MGRKNRHTKKELKALILDETWNIIKNEGFRYLSTRKIARNIGYSAGSLYNFFNSFDELILNINAKTLELLSNYIEIESENVKNNPLDIVIQFANNYFNFGKKYYPFWKLLFEYNILKIVKYPDWYQNKIDSIFHKVEKILLPYLEEDKELSVKVIWSGIHGICELVLNNKIKLSKSVTPDLLIRKLFENYFTQSSLEKER